MNSWLGLGYIAVTGVVLGTLIYLCLNEGKFPWEDPWED